jgi:CDP-diacylglycerol--glycerol-3-phosphate 3-phosphatidyltransferase
LAIGLFVLPLAGPFRVTAAVVMGAAIVLTVITGIDYVVSTVKEVRRTTG